MSLDDNDPVQRDMKREARRRSRENGTKYTAELRAVKAERGWDDELKRIVK